MKEKNDALGDRMKEYEGAEAGRRFLPQLPILARIDGRKFSNFTHGMQRPYDERMSNLMVDTTMWLVQETNANCGYTQSDEITLTWYSDDPKSQVFFDGRIQKLTSVLASMTAVRFYSLLRDYFVPPDDTVATYYMDTRFADRLESRLPHFDCRVWTVPTLEEGANTFLWREWDATKNSIQMAAQEVCSHKELHGKNGAEQREMLWQKGINWNDYPSFFKRGSFICRRKVLRKFTVSEMEKLPEKHVARRNPELMVERSEHVRVEMPPFAKVTNRVGVIYRGEEPTTLEEVK